MIAMPARDGVSSPEWRIYLDAVLRSRSESRASSSMAFAAWPKTLSIALETCPVKSNPRNSAPANRSLDAGAETCRGVAHRRTPTLTIAAMNAGEAGDEVTPTRIWDPSRLTTKCTVRGGEASDATDGCAVKVNVPVQLGFTV